MEFAGYLVGLLVGVLLGMLGGGGALLVPAMLYLLHLNESFATAYTTLLVGITALFGVFPRLGTGQIDWWTALALGVPVSVGMLLVRCWLFDVIPDVLFKVGSLDITKRSFVLAILSGILFLSFASMVGLIGKDLKPRTEMARKARWAVLLDFDHQRVADRDHPWIYRGRWRSADCAAAGRVFWNPDQIRRGDIAGHRGCQVTDWIFGRHHPDRAGNRLDFPDRFCRGNDCRRPDWYSHLVPDRRSDTQAWFWLVRFCNGDFYSVKGVRAGLSLAGSHYDRNLSKKRSAPRGSGRYDCDRLTIRYSERPASANKAQHPEFS